MDFAARAHPRPRARGGVLRRTRSGSRRSVYMPERNFAEFETGNLTLSVIHAEKMGLEHHVSGNAIALHVDDVEAARKTLEAAGRDVQRRHARHGRVPHGVLQRPRRQRADAPPPLRAAGPESLTARGGLSRTAALRSRRCDHAAPGRARAARPARARTAPARRPLRRLLRRARAARGRDRARGRRRAARPGRRGARRGKRRSRARPRHAPPRRNRAAATTACRSP